VSQPVSALSRRATAAARNPRENADMTYDDYPTWRRYQAFFPAGMRCTPLSTPAEEYWRWRGLDILHVEDGRVKRKLTYAKAKVPLIE